MPVLTCLREKLWTGLISVGDQVPTRPVFTRAKIKSRFGILVRFAVTVCQKTRKPRNKIRQTQSGDNEAGNLSKYVTVEIFNKSVKFQLDSGSDLSIISLHTWRRLNKPALLRTKKTARSSRRTPQSLFLTSVRSVALQKEQWQTWAL